ncbi:SRPBCC family protein [Lysobacter enzymogenes]|uniref:SRPBCC family protein n=1 Tax=Lysobacter enzymogenes TaxID=69 RepID=UPI001A97C8EF|nr:SRPBCC family protein [Lysobacter enzymogenes]QQP95314.1 SRPBCC family protein [Lysobacter enzymogenes]
MSPKPTGHLDGNDLIIVRSFSASVDEVWASITQSEKTALWFGRWEGEAGPGKTVRLQMLHEKGQPWSDLKIEECAAPHRLVVTMKDDYGDWRIELTLTQAGSGTQLRFVQVLSDRAMAGEVGPGWEYYLDMLVAAREGKPLPSFDDYYPAQKAHYSAGA